MFDTKFSDANVSSPGPSVFGEWAQGIILAFKHHVQYALYEAACTSMLVSSSSSTEL